MARDDPEPWRYTGGIRALSPQEQELWRVYCLAQRIALPALPMWAVRAFAWLAEIEDQISRGQQRAERQLLVALAGSGR